MNRSTELSSLDSVPMTAETGDLLAQAGIDTSTIVGGLSELGARSLLALHQKEEGDPEGAPDCFRMGYDPASVLCGGCVFQTECWRVCLPYLHGGADPKPPGVPDHVVAARVEWAKEHPLPPTGWPTPEIKPGLREDMLDDETRALFKLDYTTVQIDRMLPEVKARILAEQIKNEGVSISKGGELRFIHGPASGRVSAAQPNQANPPRPAPPPPPVAAPPPPPPPAPVVVALPPPPPPKVQ